MQRRNEKQQEVRGQEDLDRMLEEIQKSDKVQEMKQYIQHGNVSTFDHCESVARLSYDINRLLHLHADEETLVKGAMLHDFYLYDWHNEDDGTHNWHGFIHAERASENAREHMDADPAVQRVIRTHMWPLNLKSIPSSKEGWIVCLADKCVSLKETLLNRGKKGQSPDGDVPEQADGKKHGQNHTNG